MVTRCSVSPWGHENALNLTVKVAHVAICDYTKTIELYTLKGYIPQ